MQMTVLNGPSEILIVFCSHKFQTSFCFFVNSGDESHSNLAHHTLQWPWPCTTFLCWNIKLQPKKKKLILSKSLSNKNKILYKVGKLNVLAWSKWISYLCAWGHGLVVALMVGLDDFGGLSNLNDCILSSNWWLFWSPIPCTLNNLLAWGFCPAIPFLSWQSLQSFRKKLPCFPSKYFLRRKKK